MKLQLGKDISLVDSHSIRLLPLRGSVLVSLAVLFSSVACFAQNSQPQVTAYEAVLRTPAMSLAETLSPLEVISPGFETWAKGLSQFKTASVNTYAACDSVKTKLSMTPRVRAIVISHTHQGDLARCYLRYVNGLKNPDAIDQVVTPDARFHDLEASGFARGPEGVKAFRRQFNKAMPDEHGMITAMRFEGDDIIDVDLEASGTDAKTGAPRSFTIHARDRFVGNRVAERWDRVEWHTPTVLRKQNSTRN